MNAHCFGSSLVTLMSSLVVVLLLLLVAMPWSQPKGGGCFHSRTAVGMFDHVKDAVDRGEVLLEWDYAKVWDYPCTYLCLRTFSL